MFQPSSFISTNNIMIAILGISVARVQHPVRASNNEDARVTMKVDLRSRVQPPLPYTYVGNMTFPVQGDIYPPQNHQIEVENAQKADILRLTQVALQLRGKLVSINETTAYSVSAQADDQENWSDLEAKLGGVVIISWRLLRCLVSILAMDWVFF